MIVMIRRGISAIMMVIFTSMAIAQTNVVDAVVNSPDHTIEWYDMLRQQDRIEKLGFTFEGNNSVEMSVSDLDAGMYLFIINTGHNQIANQVGVVK